MFISLSPQDLKTLISESAMLGVLATNALRGYESDDVNERTAFNLYGRAWIKDRTKRGLLHFNRSGANERSPKMYSRFEIESLKLTEKNLDKFISKYGNNESTPFRKG